MFLVDSEDGVMDTGEAYVPTPALVPAPAPVSMEPAEAASTPALVPAPVPVPVESTEAAPTPTWETSAGGDYRRIQRLPGFGSTVSVLPDAPNYYGGAGAMHQYDFQKKDANGNWQYVNPGEHAEEANYFWVGVNSPQYLDALAATAQNTATPLQEARIDMPGAVGQAITRSEDSLTGGTNEDDARQELAFYTANPTVATTLTDLYTPEVTAAVNQQLADSSASAQAARAGADDGLGDLLPLLALGGLALATGGFGLAGAGGLGAAEAGSLAAADAMAGIGAAEFGSAGALGAGALGAGTVAAAPELGALASQWAALEGTPTLVMGGDLAAGGAGAFASDAGFAGLGAGALGTSAVPEAGGVAAPEVVAAPEARGIAQTIPPEVVAEQAATDAWIGADVPQQTWTDALLNNISSQFTPEKMVTNAGKQAATTAIQDVVAGRDPLSNFDPTKLIEGAVIGGLAGAAGTTAKDAALAADAPSYLANAARTATTGTVGGVLRGQDLDQALGNALESGAGGVAGGLVGDLNLGGAGSLIDRYVPTFTENAVTGALKGIDNPLEAAAIGTAGQAVGDFAGGLVRDATGSPDLGGLASSLAGGAVKTALTDTPTAATQTTALASVPTSTLSPGARTTTRARTTTPMAWQSLMGGTTEEKKDDENAWREQLARVMANNEAILAQLQQQQVQSQ